MARTKSQSGKAATGANKAVKDNSNNQKTEFRFYDNRQNYLSFINTTNEKSAIAKRAGKEFQYLRPAPPALRLYDAGMGDATVLVLTNLNYADCRLMPSNVASANAMNWQEIKLEGSMSYGYKQQLESMHPLFAHGWETQTSKTTGNPLFKRPSVVVIYRQDHQILLDAVIPRPGLQNWYFDFILASQPWRARTSAKFKAEKIVAPLVRSLAQGGRMLVIQSCGRDPAEEVIREFWPDESPFPVSRHEILTELRNVLGRDARHFKFREEPDEKAIFSYRMHTLPSEIGGTSIGTSTLFAAWNASVYVNQIEDQRIETVINDGSYLKATEKVLNKHGGLHFNDEAFVISRYHD